MKPWLVVVAPLLLAACAGQPSPLREETPVSGSAASPTVTYLELDELNRALADRYVSRVADACASIRQTASTRPQRAKALAFRLQSAAAAYDIVSARDPMTQLGNLLVLAELQALVWAEEGRAESEFGPREGTVLKSALLQAREEVRAAGARKLPPERQESLLATVRDWRRRFPQTELVAVVRLQDLAPAGEPAGAAFGLGVLTDAVKQVEETRLLGERALYFAKRMPQLMSWHLEAATEQIVDRPEAATWTEGFRKAVDVLDRAVAVLERAPETVATERKAIVAAVDEREKRLSPLLAETKAVVAETDQALRTTTELMKELRAVVKEAEPLAARFEKSKPVDPKEVTAAAAEMTRTIQELHAVLRESRELLDSPAWTRRLEEVNRAAAERLAQASTSARGVAWIVVGGALATAALVCGTLLAIRRPA